MNKTIKYISVQLILLTALLLTVNKANSQQLRGLTSNPLIQDRSSEIIGLKSTKVLTLPFFEDFSDYRDEFLPRTDKWIDQMAFINSSFPDSCISIGVATLDAIDAYGNVYAVFNAPTPSDTLTSQPIDLSNTSSQNIFFAFFYQGGGKGDAPETEDSLFLDFYSSIQNKWVNAWVKEGIQMHTFSQVVIEVADSLKNDRFQFRFRNLTSMSPDEVIGRRGALSNVDQWHIDYIELREAENAESMTILNDVAFIEPLKSTQIAYESIPWKHLTLSQGYGQANVNPFVLRKMDGLNTISVGRNHLIYDVLEDNILKEAGGDEGFINDITGNTIVTYNDDLIADVMSYDPAKTYGKFEIISYIDVNAGWGNKRVNDTLKRTETYLDYYAYDDGIPEFGFGISGESADGTKLAYRFQPYIKSSKPDTLTDIDIYFNKTKDNYTSDLEFSIAVWENNGSQPGKIIYRSANTYRPTFTDDNNQFIRFPIDSLLLVTDTFYIGMIQHTDAFINIGYDVNRDTRDEMFINTGSKWYNPSNSIKGGSLMIRAVFGKSHYQPKNQQQGSSDIQITIYPNPAVEYITIDMGNTLPNPSLQYSIIDLTGRVVNQGNYTGNPVNVSQLLPGAYIIQLTVLETNKTYHTRFVKGY